MKKVILSLTLSVFSIFAFSQVFNTGQTLKKGTFSLGLNPAYHINGPSDGINIYFHGGYGIKQGIDLSIKFGVGDTQYFGADLEWALGKKISLTTGAHDFGEFGLDGTLNFTIPLRSGTKTKSPCFSI